MVPEVSSSRVKRFMDHLLLDFNPHKEHLAKLTSRLNKEVVMSVGNHIFV